ncbi:molybdopterin molybdotransferase MoeA [Kurthia sibirica]|uniref:Molybdopterin molybdenumtransferase n=1 Tax=Kurthia sibirica TaxID=202750 RepID=A0A2U3AKN9_9BACL|nr:gephyrin-like molybdotransferase Glp [Kurthia sibirica]PWI25117.1 molybdopterin molybdenumtransferase [Kurthia sibirica]GEK34038.1 molybdopterin molybdenumtransferase [Kurthia sibirica]
MVEKRIPLAVSQAVQHIMNYASEGPEEYVSLESAYTRFLAQDIAADQDVPPFNRSPYDGFAIRAMDSQSASAEQAVRFKVVGTIGAGFVFEERVQAFEAVRIMTGAPIPLGCDAVVMLELTMNEEVDGQAFMSIKRPYTTGTNISYQGEDVKKGDILIEKGQSINPGIVALLATFGYAEVPVFRKPIVGIIATGSELLEPNEALVPGKIRNSNAYMTMAQIERAGATVKYFGKFSDDLAVCIDVVKEALSEVDLLITTGGVSVGDFDHLPAIYAALEAEVLFNKVAMRPGSVTTVAALNGQLLFGLSGNPSACYVGFELFVKPIIRRILGSAKPHLRKEKALLGEDFTKANPFTRFVRATIHFANGQLIATPSGFNKSSAVSSLATADAFIVLPGGSRGYEKEMLVDVLLLDDLQGSEWPWDNITKYSKL